MRKAWIQLPVELLTGSGGAVAVKTLLIASVCLIGVGIALTAWEAVQGVFLVILAGFGWIGLLVSGALYISSRKVCGDCSQVWHLAGMEDLPKLCPECLGKVVTVCERELNQAL